MQEQEIWKDIPEYEGIYQASNYGRIKSKKRSGAKGGILNQTLQKNGYKYVHISINGKAKLFRSHRIIANIFVCNPENKKYVNHKNGIKDDNRAVNLEWCTASENQKHAYDIGLKIGPWTGKGGKDYFANKKVAQYDLKGNFIQEYDSIKLASEKTGIERSSITRACRKTQKHACYYIWEYI